MHLISLNVLRLRLLLALMLFKMSLPKILLLMLRLVFYVKHMICSVDNLAQSDSLASCWMH